MKNFTCKFKALSQYRYNIDIHGFATRPIDSMYLNIRLYYRYNTFEKMMDVWEDVCKSLRNIQSSLLMKSARKVIPRNSDTNIFDGCPYSKELYYHIANISTNTIEPASFVPAGRYLLEVNITQGLRKKSIVFLQAYVQARDYIIHE